MTRFSAMNTYGAMGPLLLAIWGLLLLAVCVRLVWIRRKKRQRMDKRRDVLLAVGREGEAATADALSRVKGYKELVRNVYIPKAGGAGTVEVDMILVHRKGIFVVENKNYTGWIYGREEDGLWRRVLPNREQNSFYSPVRQNDAHIRHLRRLLAPVLPPETPYFSVIVFNRRARLKRIRLQSGEVIVTCEKKVRREIHRRLRYMRKAMSRDQVDQVSRLLNKLANVGRRVPKTHEKQVMRAAKKRGRR